MVGCLEYKKKDGYGGVGEATISLQRLCQGNLVEYTKEGVWVWEPR